MSLITIDSQSVTGAGSAVSALALSPAPHIAQVGNVEVWRRSFVGAGLVTPRRLTDGAPFRVGPGPALQQRPSSLLVVPDGGDVAYPAVDTFTAATLSWSIAGTGTWTFSAVVS